MGKRKKAAKKPAQPKKVTTSRNRRTACAAPPCTTSSSANASQKEALSTTFQCLFCNHENSILVKLDKKAAIGHLSCKVCGVSFQCNINGKQCAQSISPGRC